MRFFPFIFVKSSIDSLFCLEETNLISEEGVETLDCIGGLGASLFFLLGCLSALWLVLGGLGVLGVLGAGGLADEGLLEAEADLSAAPLLETSLEAEGGEGGIKLGGGAFKPAILPSEINFLKLLKSSLSSLVVTAGGATVGITGGGGGGGGGSISSDASTSSRGSFLDWTLWAFAPVAVILFRLCGLLFLSFLTGLGLLLWLILLVVDLTSILCTKFVGETPVAEGAPSGGTRSPRGRPPGKTPDR